MLDFLFSNFVKSPVIFEYDNSIKSRKRGGIRLAKTYQVIYERKQGSIDFSGEETDIYYLFYVVHELGRLIYEIEYQKPLSDNTLITLKHLNADQTIAEIKRILHIFSSFPSPSIQFNAFIEVINRDEIYTTIELKDKGQKHSNDQLITDLYLFQLFSHLNLLRGYDFSDLDEFPEEKVPSYVN